MPMKYHMATDETLQALVGAVRGLQVSGSAPLTKDAGTGRYDNQELAALLAASANKLAYGVSIPKSATVACTKTAANAGVANPTPGIIGRAAVDPYRGIGPFVYYEVNGGVDADGTPYVTAIEGDGDFARDGSNGNVWIMTPVLWWGWSEGDEAIELTVCDTKRNGLSVQPGGLLPDGSQRPYMLYAKYAMGGKSAGTPQSVSGEKVWTSSLSHNSLITNCESASTGYSGRSVADDWYVKVMFLLKYATKNSQSVFGGCTEYNTQKLVSVAQTNAKSVILSNADAANYLVGSSVMVGRSNASTDRNTSTCYDITDTVKILSKTPYDEDNTRLNLDLATGITTTVASYVSTAPWYTGSCDLVEGDGSPTSPTSRKEPYVIQGIECSVGVYELFGDVVAKNTGSGWQVYVNHDSKNEATAVSSNYVQAGELPSDTVDGWHYAYYPVNMSGYLCGDQSGASTSTGLCDGLYLNKTETTGEREVGAFGSLTYGALAGLWFAHCPNGLGAGAWSLGSRLSATGRSKG